MATNKTKTNTGKKEVSGERKATMHNVSRFDDDGYGIYNVKMPGDNKKKSTARKK